VAVLAFPNGAISLEIAMSLKRIHFVAVTAWCFLGTPILALAQISGPGSTSTAPGAASPAGTPSAPASVPGGIGPAPAPTPGQSITITPNAPAPTPGQSIAIPGPRPVTRTDSVGARPPPTPPRMHSARTPRQAATVGSGSSRPESPSRSDCFWTPSILNESGKGGNQDAQIAMPALSPLTGRPAATTPRC
jgi:hypothetical protein